MKWDKEIWDEMLAKNYVIKNKHAEEELYIYNYSQSVQYEGVWNEVTLNCRGLIMDKNGRIIARPFSKFFNLEEIDRSQIPALPFEVYDKLDGSLGIMYFVNQKPYIATRGSFHSDQAIKATALLYTKYSHCIGKLNSEWTYLFEIIYPENRIVVDYGSEEKLVLIAVIETSTGKELSLVDIGFPLVKNYEGIHDIDRLKSMENNVDEGFVVKFQNGFRVKIKFSEYIRLHKIITQISNITIWQHLSSNDPLEEILERVPDEFYNWVKSVVRHLHIEFKKIEEICQIEYKTMETRKDTASYFLTCTHPSILFLMLDNKDYSKEIWKKIRPSFSKPFSNQKEV